MTTIVLVRHGQTDAIDNYISGTTLDTPLNVEGRAQVQRLVERLRVVPLSAIVSSPLTRTRETADPIAANHGLQVEETRAFLELDFGAWTGRTFRELDREPEWKRFNAVRSVVRAPGGELMLHVQQRAVGALLDLCARYPTEHIVVVSHGDVIRAILMFWLGMPLDCVHRIEISPASISIVTLDGWTPTVRQVNGDSVRGAE